MGFSYIGGNILDTHLGRVPIAPAFQPTQPRPWVIDFWNLDLKWVFVAAPFGFSVMLLFYYDHVSCESSPALRVPQPLLVHADRIFRT